MNSSSIYRHKVLLKKKKKAKKHKAEFYCLKKSEGIFQVKLCENGEIFT